MILHIEYNASRREAKLLEVTSYERLPLKVRHIFKRSKWTIDPIPSDEESEDSIMRLYINLNIYKLERLSSDPKGESIHLIESIDKLIITMTRDKKIQDILDP